MRNGAIFPNKLLFGHSLKICVITGLCCYVVMLGIVGLAHDHSEHCYSGDTCHSEDTCAACFFHSQHVSVEIEFSALIYLFFFSTTLPFYEAVFLPLRLITNTRSRAPPVFFTALANFAF